jgi:hypothetical protein
MTGASDFSKKKKILTVVSMVLTIMGVLAILLAIMVA